MGRLYSFLLVSGAGLILFLLLWVLPGGAQGLLLAQYSGAHEVLVTDPRPPPCRACLNPFSSLGPVERF